MENDHSNPAQFFSSHRSSCGQTQTTSLGLAVPQVAAIILEALHPRLPAPLAGGPPVCLPDI